MSFDAAAAVAQITSAPASARQVMEGLTTGNLTAMCNRVGLPYRSRDRKPALMDKLAQYAEANPTEAPSTGADADEVADVAEVHAEPETTEPEAIEPEAAEPEAADGDREPEGTVPETAEQAEEEGTGREVSNPEGAEPQPAEQAEEGAEGAERDASDPEGNEPEGTEPEATEPEATEEPEEGEEGADNTKQNASDPAAAAFTAPNVGDYLLIAPGVATAKSILFLVDGGNTGSDGTVEITGRQFLIKHRSLSLTVKTVKLTKAADFKVVLPAGITLDDAAKETLVIAARPERFGPGGTEAKPAKAPSPDATATGTMPTGEAYILTRYGTTVVLRVAEYHAYDVEMADAAAARREFAELLVAMETGDTATVTDRTQQDG